jgi:hypothetical protein
VDEGHQTDAQQGAQCADGALLQGREDGGHLIPALVTVWQRGGKRKGEREREKGARVRREGRAVGQDFLKKFGHNRNNSAKRIC